MSVRDLVESYRASGTFNAGRLAEACALLERMMDEGCTVAATVAGAMTPAGMGGALMAMMERGFIDFIISTGANLYHDLHFALDLPVHQGDFRADDRELLEDGIVRIYDLFVTNEALFGTDKFLLDLFMREKPKRPISTSTLHRMIGEEALRKAKYPEKSIVAQAARLDVPIYTSSPGDSSIGMNLAAAKLRGGSIVIDPDLDVLETTAIVFGSPKNGVVEIGGGSPKNFYLQTQPTLSQILGIEKGGHDYVIQITTDSPQYGGLSGATPSEAVSWGKVSPSDISNNVVVYADATIAFPIMASYLLSTHKPRALKRLYRKRERMVRALRNEYGRLQAARSG